MDKKAIMLVVLLLAGLVFVTGCVQQGAIKTQEQVSEAVTNISSDVSEVTTILGDIDKKFG